MNTDRQIKGTILGGWGRGVPAACRILVPEPGTESSPPAVKAQVLATGPPGNSKGTLYVI